MIPGREGPVVIPLIKEQVISIDGIGKSDRWYEDLSFNLPNIEEDISKYDEFKLRLKKTMKLLDQLEASI